MQNYAMAMPLHCSCIAKKRLERKMRINKKFALYFTKRGFKIFNSEVRCANPELWVNANIALGHADYGFEPKNGDMIYSWQYMNKRRVDDLRIVSKCLENMRYGDYFFSFFNLSDDIAVDYAKNNHGRLGNFLDEIENKLRVRHKLFC